MDVLSHWSSPLGGITLASDGTGLTGLWFDGQKHFGSTLSGPAEELSAAQKDPASHQDPAAEIFAQAEKWLTLYFQGKDPGFAPPLALRGTEFQKKVWEILASVPYGSTTTYGAIARRIADETGRAASARAVGAAVGRNPVSLIIPCHRVVGSDGSLTGYAGGLDKKKYLLQLESGR